MRRASAEDRAVPHLQTLRLVRLTVVWTAAGLLAACGGSGGGTPGTPGPIPVFGIFFAGSGDGDFEIYGIDPATGTVVPLTSNAVFDSDPSATEDGARVVFTSDRASPADVFIMNGDGSGQ